MATAPAWVATHGRGGMGGGMALETAATAIGITADELKTELDAGKTIADVATEQGVAVQTVIDAIVADRTADITQRVTDMVNGVAPTPPADDATDTSDDHHGDHDRLIATAVHIQPPPRSESPARRHRRRAVSRAAATPCAPAMAIGVLWRP